MRSLDLQTFRISASLARLRWNNTSNLDLQRPFYLILVPLPTIPFPRRRVGYRGPAGRDFRKPRSIRDTVTGGREDRRITNPVADEANLSDKSEKKSLAQIRASRPPDPLARLRSAVCRRRGLPHRRVRRAGHHVHSDRHPASFRRSSALSRPACSLDGVIPALTSQELTIIYSMMLLGAMVAGAG